jgi:2-amino-4-hydroxy-6-hydroxymethyldihydropteridine diphosphokinase
MERIIFCLGSNLGDRKRQLNDAINKIIKNLSLTRVKRSDILENKAMLLPNSPIEWDMDFLNIAISGDIDIHKFSPLKILDICKKIEKDLGRSNKKPWSPREIDIDIIKIGDLKINIEKILVIPHPGLKNRLFVRNTISQIETINSEEC